MEEPTPVDLDAVREDLWAVMEWNASECEAWCCVLIARSTSTAVNRRTQIQTDHTLGVVRRAKVIHPTQRMVEIYCLCKNEIVP